MFPLVHVEGKKVAFDCGTLMCHAEAMFCHGQGGNVLECSTYY